MKAEDKIKELQKVVDKNNDEINTLVKLTERFPDLEIHKNRWGEERYSAKSVNKVADKWYYGHSCGCCEDAALEIYFYIEIDGVKIHSNPDKFYIGEKSDYSDSGYRIEFDFEKKMIEAEINLELIQKVKIYYSGCEEKEEDEP